MINNDRVSLYLGDCLEIMKDIPDKSIDLILCDLPYGTVACPWDIRIPFELLWEQYNRILKNKGVVVLFGSQPFSTLLVGSNIKNFKEEIIWLKNKSGSGIQAKKKNIKIHENIYVFSNESGSTFNPQKWLVSDKEFLTQRKTFKESYVGNNIYSPMKRVRKEDDGTRNPISIVSCAVPFTPSKSKKYSKDIDLRLHPTQKPVELLSWLIKTYSNEGEMVLDNCMGSGSTGESCLRTNRLFIGIEKDEEYFDIAKNRLDAFIKNEE